MTLLMTEESSAAAEAVALLPVQREAQLMGLANRVQRCVNSAEDNLGIWRRSCCAGATS